MYTPLSFIIIFFEEKTLKLLRINNEISIKHFYYCSKTEGIKDFFLAKYIFYLVFFVGLVVFRYSEGNLSFQRYVE